MLLFNGAYEHTIDAKNRVAIPAPFRSKISPERDGRRMYIVPGDPLDSLWIYTESTFLAVAAELRSALVDQEDLERFKRVFFSNVDDVEPDSQGRIVLPERLMRLVNLEREVMLCGAHDHIEIRNKSAYEREHAAEMSDYSGLRRKALRALEARSRPSWPQGEGAANQR